MTIDAYVPPDEVVLDDEVGTIAQSNRSAIYVRLLIILVIFFGVAIIVWLVQNRPEARPNNTRLERIERIQRSHQCDDNEIVVVTEFAPGLYKAYCVAKG